jgi:hypothetical protein
MDVVNLQSRSLLPGIMESQENILSCDMQIAEYAMGERPDWSIITIALRSS